MISVPMRGLSLSNGPFPGRWRLLFILEPGSDFTRQLTASASRSLTPLLSSEHFRCLKAPPSHEQTGFPNKLRIPQASGKRQGSQRPGG